MLKNVAKDKCCKVVIIPLRIGSFLLIPLSELLCVLLPLPVFLESSDKQTALSGTHDKGGTL